VVFCFKSLFWQPFLSNYNRNDKQTWALKCKI